MFASSHTLTVHLFVLVSGGPEQWHWGGFWRVLWSEQPVQWNREHHHQCLDKSLLLWQTSGREGWGENIRPSFFMCMKGFISDHIKQWFNCDVHMWIPPNSDWICTYGRRKVCVPHPSFSHVWIYDQLHPQTQTPAREIHDEQCTGELHHPTGVCARASVHLYISMDWCVFICFVIKSWPPCVFPSLARWCPTEKLRRLCCASPLCLKCPLVNTELSTTSTD